MGSAVTPISPGALDPMSRAFAEARLAGARGEVPVGAVLVRDGAVLAAAGNLTRETPDPTGHAEMRVIRAGFRLFRNSSSLGSAWRETDDQLSQPCHHHRARALARRCRGFRRAVRQKTL